MIETYDSMLKQVGGQLDYRFAPRAHYGLKQIDQHMDPSEALSNSMTFEASDLFRSWIDCMGKQADHASYQAEAVTSQACTTPQSSRLGYISASLSQVNMGGIQ